MSEYRIDLRPGGSDRRPISTSQVREPPRVRLYFAVDDVAARVTRVRELGGEASGPEEGPSGLWAECTDDQGTPFMIGWLRPELR